MRPDAYRLFQSDLSKSLDCFARPSLLIPRLVSPPSRACPTSTSTCTKQASGLICAHALALPARAGLRTACTEDERAHAVARCECTRDLPDLTDPPTVGPLTGSAGSAAAAAAAATVTADTTDRASMVGQWATLPPRPFTSRSRPGTRFCSLLCVCVFSCLSHGVAYYRSRLRGRSKPHPVQRVEKS